MPPQRKKSCPQRKESVHSAKNAIHNGMKAATTGKILSTVRKTPIGNRWSCPIIFMRLLLLVKTNITPVVIVETRCIASLHPANPRINSGHNPKIWHQSFVGLNRPLPWAPVKSIPVLPGHPGFTTTSSAIRNRSSEFQIIRQLPDQSGKLAQRSIESRQAKTWTGVGWGGVGF